MASRVNVKFVVILSAALGLVFLGVAGALYYVKSSSGERNYRRAEAALAGGDIEAAYKFYARAVNKEPTNVAWLTAWRDVAMKRTPDTQSGYIDAFQTLGGIQRNLAIVQKTNLEAHRDYLESLYERLTLGGGARDNWEFFIGETENALRYFEPEVPPQIRRYRGIAISVLLAANAEVSKDRLKTGLADLEAVHKADPHDVLVATELAGWHRTVATNARKAGDPAAEKTEAEASRAIVAETLAANPQDPGALLTGLIQDVIEAQQVDTGGKSSEEAARMRRAAFDSLRPKIAETKAKLLAIDPKAFTLAVVDRWTSLVPGLDSKDGLDAAIQVVDHVLASDPENPDYLSIKAKLTFQHGDLEGAIAANQRIAALKDLPVSWAGMRLWNTRKRAVFKQASAAVGLVFRATTDDARKAAIARARTFRQELAKQVAENAPEMQAVDGRLLYAEGDYRGAQRLLTEFVKTPGEAPDQVPEALLFLADIGIKSNELGLARDSLLKVREMRPASPDLLIMLAGLERQLQNNDAAAAYFLQVLDIDPDNETAKRELALLKALTGENIDLKDPVMQLLAKAERTARGDRDALGDDKKAIEILRGGLEQFNYDARLVSGIVRLQLASGDAEGATRTAKEALAKHPDDAQLKTLVQQLDAAGSLEGALALIEGSAASDLEKWVARRGAYDQFGKRDEGRKAIAEAAKLAPSDPRVLEYQFRDALDDKDMPLATKIAETATAADADRTNGDTYKARLQILQGNIRDAVVTLQRAADRGNATPAVHRLLGAALLELGRGQEAVAALRRALELSPADLASIKSLISTLAQLGRIQEALDAARQAEAYGRRDAEFMNAWLALESAGGNRAFAQSRREQLLTMNPNDNANKAALADIYIDQKAWDQSRKLIDQLRAANAQSTPFAALDARWHADRGDFDAARQVFVDHIETLGQTVKPLPPDPYLVFANFMLQRGRTRDGIAAMRQAERLQDPKTMAVTIALGNTLMSLGLSTEAEKSFRQAIDAGVPDPKHDLRKRLIESYVQSQRFAEAEKEFATLGPAGDSDLELLCQHAQIAKGLGDKARAAELLNRAVAKFPDEPTPYLRRARLVMNEPGAASDALADLATALRLRPGFWQALHTRYTIYLNQNKIPDGIRDLRAAVEANPGIDPLRLELVDVLLAAGLENDAADAADAVVKDRATDTRLMQALGDHFSKFKKYPRAAKYYKRVFDQLGNEASAIAYVGALLASTPPALTEADAALASPALKVDKSWTLLMTRAYLRTKQNAPDRARADVSDALALVDTEAAIRSWYARFRAVYPDASAALGALATLRPRPTLEEWMPFFKARCGLEIPATQSEAIAALTAMLRPEFGKGVRLDVCRAVSQQLLTAMDAAQKAGKPDQAAAFAEGAIKILKQGLEIEPSDPEFNNNVAYLLSESLNRPAEAVAFAEKAAKIAPDNPNVLDTLAAVYWKAGQKEQAIAGETAVLRMTTSEADKVTYGIKLARWKAAAGDPKGARALADWMTDLLNDNPELADLKKADLDALKKDLESAPK